MLTFYEQLRAWTKFGEPHYFVLFFIAAWSLWLLKFSLSRFYKPFRSNYSSKCSVIIPVVDERAGLFHEVLRRIVEQKPDQVLVVINGPWNAALEGICDAFPLVQRLWTPQAGKRNALRLGIEACVHPIAVLVDSDTLWTESTLSELLKPFADETVGGVTTLQRISNPHRSFVTRLADWLEAMRVSFGMSALSVFGQVGCLPGRTIAFRRDILVRAMPDFLSERFLGVHLEVSDDRSLTQLTLKMGYQTVLQQTSAVLTDAPEDAATFVRQQYRWAKGSQYYTLRTMPWMLRKTPLLFLFFTADVLLPFFWVGVCLNALYRVAIGAHTVIPHIGFGQQLLLVLVGATVGLLLRTVLSNGRNGWHYVLLPFYWTTVCLVFAPLRILAFARMAYDEGWGTRSSAYAGSATQTHWRWVPVALALIFLCAFTGLGLWLER